MPSTQYWKALPVYWHKLKVSSSCVWRCSEEAGRPCMNFGGPDVIEVVPPPEDFIICRIRCLQGVLEWIPHEYRGPTVQLSFSWQRCPRHFLLTETNYISPSALPNLTGNMTVFQNWSAMTNSSSPSPLISHVTLFMPLLLLLFDSPKLLPFLVHWGSRMADSISIPPW